MRLSTIWLSVAICVLWSTSGVAAATDPRVERAREELDAAQAAHTHVQAELDRAAAQFEAARTHADRLRGEAAANARDVAVARSDAAVAQEVLRERLVLLLARPGLRGELLPAGVYGDDIAETLHRVELIGQLTQRGAQDRQRAGRALTRVHHAERSYEVVSAGAQEAVRVREDRAADLSAALRGAQAKVGSARHEVRRAEAEVAAERAARARRIARERRLAALRQTRVTSSSGVAPLPAVDGKVCPVGAPNAFGDTWGAARSGGRTHEGVDMFAASGTPLYAVGDGTVRNSNNALGGMSIHLTTDDGDRYYYAHLSQTFVTTGQRVAAGDHIGAVGNSGNARTTPPHLHWQYHPGGAAPVNPFPLAMALCR